MDSSLSDFQEAKRSHSGPKINKISAKKPRKPLKKPRGQKDIRTALKPKRNDLITYTEKFDAVCKKSGIDVDTDELQLAIALSKSLQTNASDETYQTEGSSQARIKKIRTTLQEYGFKVPETKITINNRRKHKKTYQLILKSDAEKEQIISDKYSQILFTNVEELNNLNDCNISDAPLFYKATNISYNEIKNHDVFYNIELVEKSTSNGCLLRDWAEIPGRPASPKVLNDIKMNFSEIECSQEELDIVLSGPFINTKKIMSLKQKEKLKSQNSRKNETSCEDNVHGNANIPNITIELKSGQDIREEGNVNQKTTYRSCSPDMFEDEESVIEVFANNTTVQGTRNDTMDLTECVNNMPLKNNILANKYNLSISQKSNKDMTRRKSDDFMEITDCVASTSRPIHMNVDLTQVVESNKTIVTNKNKDSLDLTQSSDSGDDLPEVFLGHKKNLDDTVPLNFSDYQEVLNKSLNSSHTDHCEVYDLTQEHTVETIKGNKMTCNNRDIEFVNNYKSSIFNSIPLCADQKINEKNINLTPSSRGLCKTVTIDQNKIGINNVDLLDEQHNSKLNSPLSGKQIYNGKITTELASDKEEAEDNIDLTQASNASAETVIIDQQNSNSSISDVDTITQNNNGDIFNRSPDKNITNKQTDSNIRTDIEFHNFFPEDNVDLTQSSNSSIENRNIGNKNDISLEPMLENSNDSDKTVILPLNDNYEAENQYNNLGKKDNISIDYDDICYIDDVSDGNTGNNTNKSKNKSNSHQLDSSHNSVVLEENNKRNIEDTIIVDDCEEILNQRYNLGKIDNLSIDYDEVAIINVDKDNDIRNNPGTSNTSKTRNNKISYACSNEENEFKIIDAELEYSLNKSRRANFDLGGISILDRLSNNASLRNSIVPICDELDELPLVEVKKDNELRECTPEKRSTSSKRNDATPENGYIIKLENVSPMPDYAAMSTPEMNKELDKYGLKPFKRKRAIKLLTHIYNQTHPIIESLDDLPSPPKRFKVDHQTTPSICRKLMMTPKEALEMLEAQDMYEVTNEIPDLKEVECDAEDWVFQKREKAKIQSCRVPLHIAFYNYVSCRRRLRESILRYEPVDIDVIHKGLVEYGHRYDPKELLKFMDKKCITVKTADSTKNNKC